MKTITAAMAILFVGQMALAATATYSVTIESNWSQAEHLALPGNAHFSPVVAVAHDSGYTLLPIGGIATDGLESLAETGRTAVINTEIQAADAAIAQSVETENQFVLRSPTQQFEIQVSEDHPFLSFVSMIAPSPDWVVGLSNLKLYTADAGFAEGSSRLPLYAINAGTEEGDIGGNFGLGNEATEPKEAIGQLAGSGFNAPFGFVTIQRIR
ncbi:MAG: spondin domain-containing protein [Pseudomonadota bacterium]